MRTFIAIEVSEEVRRGLGRVLEELKKVDADVRWVRPESVHLTLKFLGEIDPGRVTEIQWALREVAGRYRPFSLVASGIGCFPRWESPRVVWVGLEGEVHKIVALQREVEEALVALGFPREDRAFKPHLTLGRVRTPKGRQALVRKMREWEGEKIGEFWVQSLVEFESELSPSGARYTPLWKEPLLGANDQGPGSIKQGG